jgi:hypothetical protein
MARFAIPLRPCVTLCCDRLQLYVIGDAPQSSYHQHQGPRTGSPRRERLSLTVPSGQSRFDNDGYDARSDAMPEATHTDQPWSYITFLLSGDTKLLPVRHTSRARSNFASAQRIKVTVLERPRPARTSAVVSWRDLTACCYWEQLWQRCRARKRGFCALTGTEIAVGDDVYRPQLVDPAPLNIDAMILASVMETIPLAKRI